MFHEISIKSGIYWFIFCHAKKKPDKCLPAHQRRDQFAFFIGVIFVPPIYCLVSPHNSSVRNFHFYYTHWNLFSSFSIVNRAMNNIFCMFRKKQNSIFFFSFFANGKKLWTDIIYICYFITITNISIRVWIFRFFSEYFRIFSKQHYHIKKWNTIRICNVQNILHYIPTAYIPKCVDFLINFPIQHRMSPE